MRWILCLISLFSAAPAAADWLWYPYANDVPRSRGYSAGHQAIDFASACGTALYAAAEGEVTQVTQGHSCRRCFDCYQGCANSYVGGGCANNQIYIRHPNGFETRYLHIERGSAQVQVGQRVHAGQLIARSSNVGWTCGNTGCHLHFALINPNGAAVDPDAGYWTHPLRRGGGPPPEPPRDVRAPECSLFDGPPREQIHTDGGLRLRWRVDDDRAVAGAAQSWNAPLGGRGEPEFRYDGGQRHEGHLELGWAGVGRHRAYVKGWDQAGNTCEADAGEYWYFPVPFLQRWLIAGPLATEGGARDRLDDRPLGDPAALLPLPGEGAFSPVESASPHVDLDALVGGDAGLAYAATWCHNPGPARAVTLRLGSDDGFVAWLNGLELGRAPTPRGAKPDQDALEAELAPGWNLLLLAIEEKGGAWGFYARLTAPGAADQPVDGVSCGVDFREGPCAAGDCPAGYVCAGGRCALPPPAPEDQGPPPAGEDEGPPGGEALPPGAGGGGGAPPGPDWGRVEGVPGVPGADLDGGLDEAPAQAAGSKRSSTLAGGCQSAPLPAGTVLLGLVLLRRRRRAPPATLR